MSWVFTYGTLSVDDVMEKVSGRRFEKVPAVLGGHRRRRVRDQWFPAIEPCAVESVTGWLHVGIDAAAMQALDQFESEIYDRQCLNVLTEAGETIEASVYVLRPEYTELMSEEAWDEARFRRDWLPTYLNW